VKTGLERVFHALGAEAVDGGKVRTLIYKETVPFENGWVVPPFYYERTVSFCVFSKVISIKKGEIHPHKNINRDKAKARSY